MQSNVIPKHITREKVTQEELDNEVCKMLPAREELAIIDTGFTNPGLAQAAAAPMPLSDHHTIQNHYSPPPHFTPTQPVQFTYVPSQFTINPVHGNFPMPPSHDFDWHHDGRNDTSGGHGQNDWNKGWDNRGVDNRWHDMHWNNDWGNQHSDNRWVDNRWDGHKWDNNGWNHHNGDNRGVDHRWDSDWNHRWDNKWNDATIWNEPQTWNEPKTWNDPTVWNAPTTWNSPATFNDPAKWNAPTTWNAPVTFNEPTVWNAPTTWNAQPTWNAPVVWNAPQTWNIDEPVTNWQPRDSQTY